MEYLIFKSIPSPKFPEIVFNSAYNCEYGIFELSITVLNSYSILQNKSNMSVVVKLRKIYV